MTSREIGILKLNRSFLRIGDMLHAEKMHESGYKVRDAFVNEIYSLIQNNYNFKNRLSVESIAKEKYKFKDMQIVKELTEFAIIKAARVICKDENLENSFYSLVSLYEKQPYITHQTNVSVNLNQYSTPIPLGYLMGKFIGLNYIEDTKIFFEPTAGNGMLTVAGDPEKIIVNEIDRHRLWNLRNQHFKQVLSQDANKHFDFNFKFDGIIANPPFGGSFDDLSMYGYSITGLEDQIIARSLEYGKDEVKAAFIIGGHTEFDNEGRVKGKKNKSFLNYLFHYFNLKDVINVKGSLYNKQGTVYPIRIILIDGKKEIPKGFFPLDNKNLENNEPFSSKQVETYNELFRRFLNHIKK